MTYAKLDIRSGIFADRTDYSVGPSWVSSESMRFQQGLPEKIGGSVKELNWSFTGIASDCIAWRTLAGASCFAMGSEKKLELIYNDVKQDITPVRSNVTLNGPFDTTNLSAVVTVNDISHGASDGDYVVYDGAAAGGGITVDGEYILTYIDDNTYTITHSTSATSTASGTGGASVDTDYLISVGSSTVTAGLGWGSGRWGDPRTGAMTTTATVTDITQANPGNVTTPAVHGFTTGDAIIHSDVVGMTEVNGVRYVVTVVDTTHYTIGVDTSGFTAYSSAGTATKQFGWGYAANSSDSDVSLEPDIWSLSLWGEDLIATRRNSGTYQWDASTPTGRAAVVANAPTEAKLSLINPDVQHLIAFGADGDPLKVKWASQETLTTWTPAAGNTAGSHQLNAGTQIVAAVHTRGQILVFTDDVLFSMSWQGPPNVFGFRTLGDNCAPISQHSVIDQNGIVYWMGAKHFYMFDGAVKILPSPVRDQVFDNIDESLDLLSYAGINRKFTEIWWLYTTTGNTSPDKYVTMNYSSGEWSFGTIDRTVFLDEISWLTDPVAIDSSGNLYYQENGVDDDTEALTSSVETGAFEIPEAGERMFLVDQFIPDGEFTGTLFLTIFTRKWPGGEETTKGPFSITSGTDKLSIRARGRQMRFKLESTALGDFWKFGVPRIRFRVDGKG